MTTATQSTSVLNDLITICLDGEKGFAAAAEKITDSSLKLELTDYSTQRRDFAADLQSLVASTGEDPSKTADATSSLHRVWINVKAAFTSNDNHAVLAECERGEDAAVAAYKKAIDAGLPSDYSQLVQSQYAAVKRTHDRVKSLRDASKK